jgi:hypothetical protein
MLLKRLQKNMSTPKAMSLDDIKQATKEDAVLQKLVELIRNGNWASVQKDDKFSDIERMSYPFSAKLEIY